MSGSRVSKLIAALAAVLVAGCSTPAADCNCPASPPRGCVYTGRATCACAAMVCSDAGPIVDVQLVADATFDGGADAPSDVAADAARDAVADAAEAAIDAVADVPADMLADAGIGMDARTDGGGDRDADRETDTGEQPRDAGDAGDAGFRDASVPDAGAGDANPGDTNAGDASAVDAVADGGSGARDVLDSMDIPVTRTDVPITSTDAGVRDAGPVLVCDLTIVPVERSCLFDGDCTVGLVALDCCGTQHALGYNGLARSAFAALASACLAAVTPSGGHMCGCPTRGIQLDDGSFIPATAMVRATCVAGQCVSHLFIP